MDKGYFCQLILAGGVFLRPKVGQSFNTDAGSKCRLEMIRHLHR